MLAGLEFFEQCLHLVLVGMVEFCLKIPTKYRDENEGKGRLMKYILRKSFENELPNEVLQRPKKTFQVGANTDFLKTEKVNMEQIYQRLF